MFASRYDHFLIDDLQNLDKSNNGWFSDDTIVARTGRCLIDTLEYLRSDLKLPGRFRQVTDAHAVRLVCRCLSDPDLERRKILERVTPLVRATCADIRSTRNNKAPFYGDDFWDWAAVLDAFLEVTSAVPDAIEPGRLKDERDDFRSAIKERIANGLTFNADGEWYGPATAAIAYRVLRKCHDRFGDDVNAFLEPLRKQALERVINGKYRGQPIPPNLVLWHYGQVVAEFGRKAASRQADKLADLKVLKSLEKWDQVYALARVIQGATDPDDKGTFDKAVALLGECESLRRPLGQGLMGEHVKGSLNVLEAFWPMLETNDKRRLRSLLDALLRIRNLTNKIAIVVTIDAEATAVREVLDGQRADAGPEKDGITIFDHERYQVVLYDHGKGVVGSGDATRTLIDSYEPRWMIMCGIAGSLGTFDENGKRIAGPDMGDVIVATSVAPYGLYTYVGEQTKNVRVPLRGKWWLTLPTDPALFSLAAQAADETRGEFGYYEGLIVTGTGVRDSLAAKQEVLKEFPGGLAVEVEGYVVALLCMVSGIPCAVIRGISDRAQGDKEVQTRDEPRRKREQHDASLAAAKVALGVVNRLSQQW
jgi:nucleoside phosphorylase